ncbi:RISC-loading complex subunit tarbp2 [Episyrphus balteatus]|uniref:RISC-loading complex subunit tarbp2 n=1 Tax=Episyrphus balteatus TaxID=286459 RepID=UPI00248501D9|nr:RISC-loading complex subunit tarbp2 [Episyrphus balteatus]
MFGKPPVTALQEYCAKKGVVLPKYNCMDANDGSKSFMCSVEALDRSSYGHGRSKQEAKHDAAANLIQEVKVTHPDILLIPQAPHEAIPMTDAVITLRDICVQQNHPLPVFDIIQQAGPAEAPEFTVLCQLASIKRYGVANTKKAARQKAALEILKIVQSVPRLDDGLQVASVQNQIEGVEENRYTKLKTYRELTESGAEDKPGELLADRHFFFEKFHDQLRKEARRILSNETSYISVKERVGDLFRALNIKPTKRMIQSTTVSVFYFMELNLEYDVCFAGTDDVIYQDIIEYFNCMI